MEQTNVMVTPAAASCAQGCSCSAPYCTTVTIPSVFSVAQVSPADVHLLYDVSKLSYAYECCTVQASLPCGGTCDVQTYQTRIVGVIPYMVSASPVTGMCGSPGCVSASGYCEVDTVVAYACGGSEMPVMPEITCQNVRGTAQMDTSTCPAGGQMVITFQGEFTFEGIGNCNGTARF